MCVSGFRSYSEKNHHKINTQLCSGRRDAESHHTDTRAHWIENAHTISIYLTFNKNVRWLMLIHVLCLFASPLAASLSVIALLPVPLFLSIRRLLREFQQRRFPVDNLAEWNGGQPLGLRTAHAYVLVFDMGNLATFQVRAKIIFASTSCGGPCSRAWSCAWRFVHVVLLFLVEMSVESYTRPPLGF